jgi:type VI secretion system secreted protein Hcp
MVVAVQIAEGDVFVKIENSSGSIGIGGEALEQNHVGWILADSIKFGVANATALTNGTIVASKSIPSELVITKVLDKSSPPLFLSCAQGTRQPKVVLELTKLDNSGLQKVYYRITMIGVVVSGLDFSVSSSDDRPLESVSLSYEKITTDYFMQDSKGLYPTTPTSTATWSFANNSTK